MFQRRSPPTSPSDRITTSSPDDAAELGRSANKSSPRRVRRGKKRSSPLPDGVPPVLLAFGVVVMAGLFFVVCVATVVWRNAGTDDQHDRALSSMTVADHHHLSPLQTQDDQDGLLFQCPVAPEQQPQDEGALNFDPVRFQNHYLHDEAHRTALEDFVARFRDRKYDDWDQTYAHMKRGMTAWKRRAFIPYLKAGDAVYESAIGIGLNALMTLEILQQEKPSAVTGLSLYGNEYLRTSTVRANEFLDRMLPPLRVRKGAVCVGDSTNISYVPSDAFDFVYTGYILPIGNPLHFDQPDLDPYGINHGRYHELCDGSDWRDVTLRQVAQRRQEDFYAAWVGEMIRIAKPGKPVIVEHVSQPKCEDRADWGGVAKSWWYEAIGRYNWAIDPDSIFMEDDHIYTFQRYHVFMRKKSE